MLDCLNCFSTDNPKRPAQSFPIYQNSWCTAVSRAMRIMSWLQGCSEECACTRP